MKTLILAACLFATICAYHIKKTNFDVVIDSVEYTNIPSKYQLGKGISLPQDALAPIEKVLTEVAKNLKTRPTSGTQAIMNDYADKVFANLQNIIIHAGLDPVELPDQHTGFNYTLIIVYHGELDLTHGWLQDISTIHRGGDVLVSYSSNTKYLEVTVPITFDDMQFTYDYSAKIMGLGPSGGVEGKIKNIGIEVKIGFDVVDLVASLDEFVITNSGHIDVNFNGNPLVDWLINLLTDVVTALLKPLILGIVEAIIRGTLDSTIQAINDAIHNFIDPTTTPIPTTTPVSFFLN